MAKKKTSTKKAVKSKIKKDSDSVGNILKTFKDNLHSIEFFFNKFGEIAENEDEGAITNSLDYMIDAFASSGIDIDEKKGKKKEKEKKLNKDELNELFRKLSKTPKISSQNFQILSSSSFLMLNNYFEFLIANLLSYHYYKFKDVLNSKELKVSLKEIEEYETVEDLKRYLILKEVESMLVESSFNSLLSHFEKNLNISLSNDIVDWDVITECRERRHLIVHNASIVNKKYLTRTSNPEKKKIGDKLKITKEYFLIVFKEIKLAGLLLSYECWGNWDKEKATKAIKDMLDESFESLTQNEIIICDKITTYISKIEPKDENQEDLLLRAKFNKCISLKKQSKKTELNKILKTIKIGTSTPLFKLAHAILSEKNDELILELIEQSHKIEEINFDFYLNWPLFEFTRKNDVLNKKIEDKLKSPPVN